MSVVNLQQFLSTNRESMNIALKSIEMLAEKKERVRIVSSITEEVPVLYKEKIEEEILIINKLSEIYTVYFEVLNDMQFIVSLKDKINTINFNLSSEQLNLIQSILTDNLKTRNDGKNVLIKEIQVLEEKLEKLSKERRNFVDNILKRKETVTT